MTACSGGLQRKANTFEKVCRRDRIGPGRKRCHNARRQPLPIRDFGHATQLVSNRAGIKGSYFSQRHLCPSANCASGLPLKSGLRLEIALRVAALGLQTPGTGRFEPKAEIRRPEQAPDFVPGPMYTRTRY
jgi:hypothetical protein